MNIAKNDDKNKIYYFVFSQEQFDKMKEIHEKSGVPFEKKYVIVKGKSRIITDIIDDETKSKYSDTVVLTKGTLDDIKVITKTV